MDEADASDANEVTDVLGGPDSDTEDASDPGDASPEVIGCEVNPSEGSYVAAVRLEYAAETIIHVHYENPFDDPALLYGLRYAAQALGLTEDELSRLNGFQVSFERSLCRRLRLSEHGELACSTFDSTTGSRTGPVTVQFLEISPAGDAPEEVVLRSMDVWLNLHSASASTTWVDGTTGEPLIYYSGTQFEFAFAHVSDSSDDLESFPTVGVYSARCAQDSRSPR